MSARVARPIALLLCLVAAPPLARAQLAEAEPSLFETIVNDLKLVVSKEALPVLSSAAALSLLALPFDETLTYSASCSTFVLKHAIARACPDGEPRSFPTGHATGTFAAATVLQRHFGLKGAAVGILLGRAATFELGRRRLSLAPAVTEGGLLVAGSIC